jgi:hypothetical protein
MSDARAYIISALQRVVDGGDITADELSGAIPDPLVLDDAEKGGWEQLSHWADDDDIREKDPDYANFKRECMRDHIAKLSGYLPAEIERGEHQAWHVPLSACAAAILLAAGAAYLLLS